MTTGGCDGRERCLSPEKSPRECTVNVYETENTQRDVQIITHKSGACRVERVRYQVSTGLEARTSLRMFNMRHSEHNQSFYFARKCIISPLKLSFSLNRKAICSRRPSICSSAPVPTSSMILNTRNNRNTTTKDPISPNTPSNRTPAARPRTITTASRQWNQNRKYAGPEAHTLTPSSPTNRQLKARPMMSSACSARALGFGAIRPSHAKSRRMRAAKMLVMSRDTSTSTQ
jgi:hypothetical protein